MGASQGNSICLGNIVNRNEQLLFTPEQRATHLHVVGNTGSGKSKFLEHLIRQDILDNRRSGSGLLLIDPHGALYDNLLAWMARVNLDRPVIPIDLRRSDWIVSYNVLRQRNAEPSVVVDSLIDAIAHVWGASSTKNTPLFARWATNLFRVLYEKRYTLADAVHLLSHETELRQAMVAGCESGMTTRDWGLAEIWNPKEFEEQVGSTVNRLRAFVDNNYLKTIFGQPDVSLDLGAAMEEGSIILVSLGRKGARVSKEDADLFGTLLLTDLWTAASEREKSDKTKPFSVYLDEFQRFLTPSLSDSLDESRGFGLRLTCSHQFPLQLRDSGDDGRRIYNSIMESARSKVVFSLATKDNLQPMAEWLFFGVLNPDEVKHELYSSKVMDYCVEYQKAYSYGTTTSEGGTKHSSSTDGEGTAGGSSFDQDGELSGETDSWNRYFANAYGETESWSRSRTETESESPMLMPIMGKELSSVQFRSLDEQLHRAMAALFDQKQRQCVARLVGMRTPVSLFAPFVEPTYIRPERVEEYIQKLYEKMPFALRAPEARACLAKRNTGFAERVIAEFRQNNDEPIALKRRIR